MNVAVAQLRAAAYDVDANVRRTVEAIGEAAAGAAELIVLPELASTGYALDGATLRAVAERGDGSGPALSAWREAAATAGVAVVGGFAELDGDRLYNSVAVIDRAGVLLGRYRKLHLFGTEVEAFSAGDAGLPIYEIDGVRVGVLVCYDLRFPEAMRLLALQGADLIATPTAWVTGFDRGAEVEDERVGQVEGVLVQANLNQVYVACGDCCGELDGVRFLGRSLIASPYGEPLAGPMGVDEERVAIAIVDPEEALQARDRGRGMRPREERRTDVYSLVPAAEEPGAKGGADGEALLREIERRRGYVLDLHRSLARLDPDFLADYEAFLHATFLKERSVDRRVKELVYVGVLMAQNAPEDHLVTHMRAAVSAGATEREVLDIVEQVLAPAGVPRFMEAVAAFECAFPDWSREAVG